MTLSELVVRLEAAMAGSWELDASICETIVAVAIDRDNPCLWSPGPLARGGEVAEMEALEALDRVHPYTRSTDAALRLVPEGWGWQVRAPWRGNFIAPIIRAIVFYERTGMVLSSEYCEAKAHTAPIALCIAALRARAIASTTRGAV